MKEVYPEDAIEGQTKRWNNLITKFKQEYGKLPDFISRSPGRVNIIGEVCNILRAFLIRPSPTLTAFLAH